MARTSSTNCTATTTIIRRPRSTTKQQRPQQQQSQQDSSGWWQRRPSQTKVATERLLVPRRSAYYSIFLLQLLSSTRRIFVEAAIGADGQCRLVIFTPFTYQTKGVHFYGPNGTVTANLGFGQMATALMAMEHFNQRDSSVVPELALPLYQNCTVQLTVNTSRVYNEGSVTHTAAQSLLQDVLDRAATATAANEDVDATQVLPCAIAGPYNDIPAQDLSLWAVSAQVPLVAARAFNMRVTHSLFAPFSNQVYPNPVAHAQALVKFLQHIGRDNYTAILYNVGDTATQHQEIVSLALEEASITYRSYRYIMPSSVSIDSTLVNVDVNAEVDNLYAACQRIKADGYRTIVSIMEFHEVEFQVIADAADEHGLTNGDHVWIFSGVDITVFGSSSIDLNGESVAKLLAGAALLTPVENYQLETSRDAFAKAWFNQSPGFVDRVNQMNPYRNEPNHPGYFQAPPDYFQPPTDVTLPPLSLVASSAFVFDAVMTIGMGACLAQQQQQREQQQQANSARIITGLEHLNGIRSVNFTGATGRVQLGDGESFPGVRTPNFVRYMVVNMFPPMVGEQFDNNWFQRTFVQQSFSARRTFRIPFVLDSKGGPLSEASFQDNNSSGLPYIYRSGLTVPPTLLRTPPNQNYLSKGMRITGLFLFSIAAAASMACGMWVYWRSNHRVVLVAQPYSLLLVCFGSFVTSWTIFLVSFDESYGWSEQQLSRACMSAPWLVSLGQIITYGALFSKLWRVNKVLQFRRTVVQVRHVAWPASLLIVCTIVWLTIISILHPLHWERVIIDEDTGASMGRCSNDANSRVFVLGLFMFIPMVLTAFMAWKTNDVDDALSESWWIFSLMATQFEVMLLSITLFGTLRNLDTNGRYFGIVFMLWTFPASQLLLIILPKIVAYRKAIKGTRNVQRRGRTPGGEVRVTGIDSNSTTAYPTSRSSTEEKSRVSLNQPGELENNNTQPRDSSVEDGSYGLRTLPESCCENQERNTEEWKHQGPTDNPTTPITSLANGVTLDSVHAEN